MIKTDTPDNALNVYLDIQSAQQAQRESYRLEKVAVDRQTRFDHSLNLSEIVLSSGFCKQRSVKKGRAWDAD